MQGMGKFATLPSLKNCFNYDFTVTPCTFHQTAERSEVEFSVNEVSLVDNGQAFDFIIKYNALFISNKSTEAPEAQFQIKGCHTLQQIFKPRPPQSKKPVLEEL